MVDDGTGFRVAEIGETFPEGDVGISFEAVYTEPPQPGPEPTPTPTEEVTTAQTGDSCEAVLPLAILAVLAAGAVLYSRKRTMLK